MEYVILAALALSFLVFIHEVGHYIVAKWVGMRVEVFSIGFGKPLFSWMFQDVKWQIGILPFGGFVKIAGMEQEGGKEPHEIEDGFYGKKPIHRIAVALAGPVVNITFAFLVFVGVWMSGGLEKPFSEYTKVIGSVDPHSELYELGVRPGDTIASVNGAPYTGLQQLLFASVTSGAESDITGEKIDYLTGSKKAFDYTVKPYTDPRRMDKDFKTVGIMAPANYLIYSGGMAEGAPAENSGIAAGDRLIWADGQLLFSTEQLTQLINEQKALLTVDREGKVLQVRVPRLLARDLRLSFDERSELDDWRYEADIKSHLDEITMIPFRLNSSLIVEGAIPYVNAGSEDDKAEMLKAGDHILAVDGTPIETPYALLKQLQERRVIAIVDRATPISGSYTNEDIAFEHSVDWKALGSMIAKMGTQKQVRVIGTLQLLEPITPVQIKDYPLPPEEKAKVAEEFNARRTKALAIEDPQVREQALALLKQHEERYVLGVPFHDLPVIYNPGPSKMFMGVLSEMYKTLSSLFTGSLSPKWISGPVGIVHMTQMSWQKGFGDALYWLGLISLNLGILNLLPVPVLDGGHICFAFYEIVTRRRISAKAMQRMIIPFVVLFITLFVYITYNDITRIVHMFF